MFPFGYALTSQILITFLFSCSIFLGTIFLGLRRHGINFFSLFFPSGSPTYMAFLLVPIELLSFVARPFSLGIRLFANMLAGHVLLKILSTFILIGVFSVQTLDASSTSWVFKEGWVAEKLWPGQLNKPGNTYVGADKPGLVELTRIYSQPRVFDFSEEFERASQYQANKHKPGFEIISSIDPRKTLSPVDTGVRIGKYELQKEVPNGTFCTTSECPDLYRDALKNIFKEQPFDVKDMDSPEFQKRLRELWEAGPRPPQNPCTPEGPSSEF